MAATNPYASFLDGETPETLIAHTPVRLADLVSQIAPDELNRSPAPGKWSPREVIGHLADTEIAFAFRLRQTLAEPNHVIQPFDQERWAHVYASASFDAETALHVFTVVRNWNLILLNAVLPEAGSKPVTHPERGAMTFQTIVETMAGHDINHLRQLQAAGASRS